ncbi:hypothetical protein PROFUN_01843 [Planoprotostelium fungivorum]|uniref:GYF domain-containing protein n=1 Tax=Planoprotostelium fungivorum TaxID=1890364 RepID=A0A2P6NYT5_9EUKA|nr:hypothetical protein PROFUN_01843 [Planoprotostelium fungivorum]
MSAEETKEETPQVEAATENGASDAPPASEEQPAQETSTTQPLDTTSPCWYYIDDSQVQQGPFSFKDLFLWWKSGYFNDQTMVRNVWEENFSPLSQVNDFANISAELQEAIFEEQRQVAAKAMQDQYTLQTDPNFISGPDYSTGQQVQYEDYAVKGTFNTRGKFATIDSSGYYGAQGVPSDKDLKMMSEYFDMSQYQAQKQAAAETGEKKRKQVKGSKKFWKERKDAKRKAKLIAEYLAD